MVILLQYLGRISLIGWFLEIGCLPEIGSFNVDIKGIQLVFLVEVSWKVGSFVL